MTKMEIGDSPGASRCFNFDPHSPPHLSANSLLMTQQISPLDMPQSVEQAALLAAQSTTTYTITTQSSPSKKRRGLTEPKSGTKGRRCPLAQVGCEVTKSQLKKLVDHLNEDHVPHFQNCELFLEQAVMSKASVAVVSILKGLRAREDEMELSDGRRINSTARATANATDTEGGKQL